MLHTFLPPGLKQFFPMSEEASHYRADRRLEGDLCRPSRAKDLCGSGQQCSLPRRDEQLGQDPKILQTFIKGCVQMVSLPSLPMMDLFAGLGRCWDRSRWLGFPRLPVQWVMVPCQRLIGATERLKLGCVCACAFIITYTHIWYSLNKELFYYNNNYYY